MPPWLWTRCIDMHFDWHLSRGDYVRRCIGGAGGGAAPAGGGGGLAGRRRRQGRRARHAAGECCMAHVLPPLCICTTTHLMQGATGNACATDTNGLDQCPHGLSIVLQGVLGELSYESDAAERLRSELRAASAEAGQLRAQLDADAARLAAAEQVPRRSFSCSSLGPAVSA